MLRRLAASSIAAIVLFAAVPARTARRPHYGGLLRMEAGTVLTSLDLDAPATSPEQASAKNQIDSLIYRGRDPDGAFSGSAGSGAFKISSWQPGKQLLLQANENFRDGRPFVDAVEITMGRSVHDRLLDLELNKVDLTPIPPQDARHAAERGVRISQSQPDELLAIVFLDNRAGVATAQARQALSLSIDRASIVTFILQKVGEPTGGLLPQWSTGTSFLFSTTPDSQRAKELWSQITPSPKFVLGYDSADPLEQSVAERIVVNAKETGISIVTAGSTLPGSASKPISTGAPANPNALLVRVRLSSSNPATALNDALRDFSSLGVSGINVDPLPETASAEDIYKREMELVNTFRIVPLVWLPQVYGLSARVRNWVAPGPGQTWPLADVWLDPNTQDNQTKEPE